MTIDFVDCLPMSRPAALKRSGGCAAPHSLGGGGGATGRGVAIANPHVHCCYFKGLGLAITEALPFFTMFFTLKLPASLLKKC